MKVDWDALDDLEHSKAETPEQLKTEAQDAAARFGGQRSVAELQAMGSTHADQSSSTSDSNVEEEDELLGGGACWRKGHILKGRLFGRFAHTGCGSNRGCFALKFSGKVDDKDKSQKPSDDDMRGAELVDGSDSTSVTSKPLGVKRNDHNTWGICLPKDKRGDGVHHAFKVWKASITKVESLAASLAKNDHESGQSLVEANRTETRFFGSITAGIASYSILAVVLLGAYVVWIPMMIIDTIISLVLVVGTVLLWWTGVWFILLFIVVLVWCFAKAILGAVVGIALGIVYAVGFLFALAAAGLDRLFGFEWNAMENYVAGGVIAFALKELAFTCDTEQYKNAKDN